MLGISGDEVSIMPIIYPRGTVRFSSLGYFSSIFSSSKYSRPSPPLSLGGCHIQWYFKKKKGRKRKLIKPKQEKARHEERRNKMRVTVREKLVVGFGELIPMESGYYDSSYQYTATFTKDNEEPVTNLNRTSWCN